MRALTWTTKVIRWQLNPWVIRYIDLFISSSLLGTTFRIINFSIQEKHWHCSEQLIVSILKLVIMVILQNFVRKRLRRRILDERHTRNGLSWVCYQFANWLRIWLLANVFGTKIELLCTGEESCLSWRTFILRCHATVRYSSTQPVKDPSGIRSNSLD